MTNLGYKKMNETSELKQFCDDVLKEFKDNITDAVFCYLQSDKELMRRYLALMREYGKGKQTLNSQLAQAITREFGLKSTKRIKETPNSVLIESFSELEEK
jgi:phage/plasmid-associated DNA primase